MDANGTCPTVHAPAELCVASPDYDALSSEPFVSYHDGLAVGKSCVAGSFKPPDFGAMNADPFVADLYGTAKVRSGTVQKQRSVSMISLVRGFLGFACSGAAASSKSLFYKSKERITEDQRSLAKTILKGRKGREARFLLEFMPKGTGAGQTFASQSAWKRHHGEHKMK